jgi:hypothetical protein
MIPRLGLGPAEIGMNKAVPPGRYYPGSLGPIQFLGARTRCLSITPHWRMVRLGVDHGFSDDMFTEHPKTNSFRESGPSCCACTSPEATISQRYWGPFPIIIIIELHSDF